MHPVGRPAGRRGSSLPVRFPGRILRWLENGGGNSGTKRMDGDVRRSAVVLLLGWMLAMGFVATPGGAQSPAPDALDDALAVAGLTRADLGWEARGWWERYPQDVAYKLRHFDDLCAKPLAIVPFTRVMGATVRVTLAPEMVDGKKNDQGSGASVSTCPFWTIVWPRRVGTWREAPAETLSEGRNAA